MIQELYTKWRAAADRFAVVSNDEDSAFVDAQAATLETIEAEFFAAYYDTEFGGASLIRRHVLARHTTAQATVETWVLADGSTVLLWRPRNLRNACIRRADIPSFDLVPKDGDVIFNGWILAGFDADRYREKRAVRGATGFWGDGSAAVFAAYP